MAAGKGNKPKKKSAKSTVKNQSSQFDKALIIVIISVLVICLFFYLFLYRDKLKEKADDFSPPAFTYPTTYEEYVVKYSKVYNVDPVLVFSVIKVESDFNPKAESNVGARGLMQLMPDAYDWVKFRIEDTKSKSFDDMYDPETNIKYGAYYLSYLDDKYDGSVELTAAAYHCGMGLVDGWLDDGTIDKENFDVKDIPEENDQTAHYINKVTKAYSKYKEILKEQAEKSNSTTNSKEE